MSMFVSRGSQQPRHFYLGDTKIELRINHDLVEQVLAERAAMKAKAGYDLFRERFAA